MELPPDSARRAHDCRLKPAPLNTTFHDCERRVLAAAPECPDEEARGVQMPLEHAPVRPTPP